MDNNLNFFDSFLCCPLTLHCGGARQWSRQADAGGNRDRIEDAGSNCGRIEDAGGNRGPIQNTRSYYVGAPIMLAWSNHWLFGKKVEAANAVFIAMTRNCEQTYSEMKFVWSPF